MFNEPKQRNVLNYGELRVDVTHYSIVVLYIDLSECTSVM